MGTSFIEYKEFGFWSRDNFIESWVTPLLAEMQNSPMSEKWQQSLIDDWRIQGTTASGWFLGLDKYLIDTQRKDSMLSLAKRVLVFSNPLGRETGELFIKLLEGRLETNESSPIDYLHWPEEH